MPSTIQTRTTGNIDVEVDIRVAQASDHDRFLDFIRTHYYPEEPLTAGSEPKEQEVADEEFHMSNFKHGTCLVALRRNVNGIEEVLGAVVAGPKDCHEAKHLAEDAALFGQQSKWGRILKILAQIERDTKVFDRYDVERGLHVHILGVHKNARGLRLGFRLMEALIALGRKRNFQILTVDCTSVYSSRICEKLGMDCIHTLRFEDYLDELGNQVFQPPTPHDSIQTYVLRLSKSANPS